VAVAPPTREISVFPLSFERVRPLRRAKGELEDVEEDMMTFLNWATNSVPVLRQRGLFEGPV